jgi:hypothetical protein
MRKSGFAYLIVAFALLLLALFIVLPSGAGPGALERESGFWGGLQNSLYDIDVAKTKWSVETHKADGDVPKMEELVPYLGECTNRIARFVGLRVSYKITPVEEMKPQSDVATLTRDLRFQRGFCRYYLAGTRFSMQGERFYPPYDTKSWLTACYQNNRGLLAIILFALAFGNLLHFAMKKVRQFRQVSRTTHAHRNA